MRGISFRFNDLRSLFYHAKQSMQAMGKTSAVEVPKQVSQLQVFKFYVIREGMILIEKSFAQKYKSIHFVLGFILLFKTNLSKLL